LFYSAAGYARDIQEGLRAGAQAHLIPQVINFLAEYRERINKVLLAELLARPLRYYLLEIR